MGTPQFAVPSLSALIEKNYAIRLVVTQPDRPAGRGQKLQPPPVKTLALSHNIPVIQPQSIKREPESLQKILQTPCDFIIVVAFGQILPLSVLEHPKVAPLNVHASMLPAYRGAAPIARAVLEDEDQTGITIQWMIEALDQGDILYQLPCAIEETDTAASLHDKLQTLGAEALLTSLQLFEEGKIVRRSQDARVGSFASKLTKEESFISFRQPAQFVHRAIMGLNPWPVAQCQLAGKNLKLFKSRFIARPSNSEPGTVVDTADGEIVVACEQGCVGLLEVQLENRKRLSSKDFLSGHPIPQGLILGTRA